jgi:hypothetical protein
VRFSLPAPPPLLWCRSASTTKLAELDLGYNEIKDDGACALAQAMKANAEGAPKDLKLNSNYITRQGHTQSQSQSHNHSTSFQHPSLSLGISCSLPNQSPIVPLFVLAPLSLLCRFGQVALSEAVDIVFEMSKKETTVHF